VGLRRTVWLLPVAVLTDSSLSTSFVACQHDTPVDAENVSKTPTFSDKTSPFSEY